MSTHFVAEIAILIWGSLSEVQAEYGKYKQPFSSRLKKSSEIPAVIYRLNRGFLKSLAYNQWMLKEIASGVAWKMLNIQYA